MKILSIYMSKVIYSYQIEMLCLLLTQGFLGRIKEVVVLTFANYNTSRDTTTKMAREQHTLWKKKTNDNNNQIVIQQKSVMSLHESAVLTLCAIVQCTISTNNTLHQMMTLNSFRIFDDNKDISVSKDQVR